MTTAIVLSGGGARGDFEVGALHYLYHQLGIRPEVLTTTSVGSVNGLKLAEGEGASDQGLAGLTQLWLERDHENDFLTDAPWLRAGPALAPVRQLLRDKGAANPASTDAMLAINPPLRDLLGLEAAAVKARMDALLSQVPSSEMGTVTAGLAGLALLPPLFNVGAILASAGVLVDRYLPTQQIESFITYEPLEALCRQRVDRSRLAAWHAGGKRLLMAVVGLASGRLRYVDAAGQVLERDLSPIMRPATAPACRGIERAIAGLRAQLAAIPGGRATVNEVRLLRKELEAKQRELDTCVASNGPFQEPIVVDVVDGMIASASIPCYVPPQRLADDVYVDGGIRAVLPVEAAIKAGATRIIGVQASSPVSPSEPVATDLLTVLLRSLSDLAINEIAYRDAHPVLPPGSQLEVIAPRIDIHGILTLYPAFVRQRMAYGWMCAADALGAFASETNRARCRAIADRISVLRYGVTRLEAYLSNRPIPPMGVTVAITNSAFRQECYDAVVAMKREIASLVAERISLGGQVPSGTDAWDDPHRWSFGQEVHPWNRTPIESALVRVSQTVLEVAPGASTQVAVTVTNTGTTVFAPGAVVLTCLPSLGTGQFPLATVIHPGQSATITATLVAPAATGTTHLVWQLVRTGSGPIPEGSEPQTFTVRDPGEPAQCRQMRTQIATLTARIDLLESQLDPTDVRGAARIRAQIHATTQQRATLVQQASALGCAL